MRSGLASEILARVKASSPGFFEQLVVELLLKMGYVGSRKDAGQAIGRSGDEGIDGVISEVRLGLDVVHVQAKKWDGTVGRPEMGIEISRRHLEGFLDYVVKTARLVRIHYLWRPTLRAPSDDMVLEVAVAAACEAIITYNVRDFSGSERFGVRALTPAEFLAELEKKR